MTDLTADFIACFRARGYGLNAPLKADYSKCCVQVSDRDTRWPRYYQCGRKNGHGPHGAYCKQHDPVALKAKADARSAKWRAEWDAKARDAEFTKSARKAIHDIAAGHNDPRALAQSILDKFNSNQGDQP